MNIVERFDLTLIYDCTKPCYASYVHIWAATSEHFISWQLNTNNSSAHKLKNMMHIVALHHVKSTEYKLHTAIPSGRTAEGLLLFHLKSLHLHNAIPIENIVFIHEFATFSSYPGSKKV